MNRILTIRGGAIGDFILTLPALKALRDAYPNAVVEILGYKHIGALVERRFYADAVRSIEYGALSGFFAKDAELDPDLREYFRSFDLVISYLFDPDGIFAANLRKCGAGRILCGPAKIGIGAHAARQLAAPIEQLKIEVKDYAAQLFPSPADRRFARELLNDQFQNLIVLHPGSGSAAKNWSLHNWLALGDRLLAENKSLLVVCGEADQLQLEALQREWRRADIRFATNLPLPHLAAVLAETVFVGHDSGISHVAAAAGAKCVLLFGPTDPAVWAPQGNNVRVISAPNGNLNQLAVETVLNALAI
jgi:heptosyltransferase-3